MAVAGMFGKFFLSLTDTSSFWVVKVGQKDQQDEGSELEYLVFRVLLHDSNDTKDQV